MPIAAVPNYLRQNFNDASPGLRFGMYLQLWGINRRTQAALWTTHDIGYEVRGHNPQEREVKYENKVSALKAATELNPAYQELMQCLLARQTEAFASVSDTASQVCLLAQSTAPFTTGLGNEHTLENGFAFLNPYGLPYLPGSGIKGVVRQAARELASGDWGETHGWSEEKTYTLVVGKDRIPLSVLDVLFGLESKDGDTEHVRSALTFWDVIPQIKGNHLMVEIMTPHQSHYYQQNPAAGSTSPHDSGQPIPISFLTVPPDSGFTFHMVCDLAHLQRMAPALAVNDQWKELLTQAFEHAFSWCGFGAKTAVGYGAMKRDLKAEALATEVRAEQEKIDRLAALPKNLKEIEEFEQAMARRVTQLNGQKDKQNTEFHQKAQKLAKDAREVQGWTPEEKSKVADAIEKWLPKVIEKIDKDALKKLKLSTLRT